MSDVRTDPPRGRLADREAAVYVHKMRVPARLSQPNLDPRDGCFLLDPREGWFVLYPHVGGEPRAESLLELLNSRRSVIPFILTGDASVLLLNRTNIDWVAVSPKVPPELIFPPGLEPNRTQRVELRFIDESRVEATIEWRAQPGQERLSDYLNACDAFVASRAGFGTLIWNKERIREARIEEEAEDRPQGATR